MLGLLVLFLSAALVLMTLMTTMLVRGARRPKPHTAGFALAHGRPCDPQDMGLEVDEWGLDVDGAHLRVWDIGGLPGSGTVVFVHGWGMGKVDMLLRLEPWLNRAGRVVLYDLRGHGESEGDGSRLGADEEHDLIALIERLDEDVTLVGYSMGAVIALNASAQCARVTRVVAHAPYDDFHVSLQGRLRVQDLPARPLTDLAMQVFRWKGIRHVALAEVARQISCPVLLVHGRSDRVCPVEHSRALVELIDGATLFEYEGVRHLDVHEAEPARYEEALKGGSGG